MQNLKKRRRRRRENINLVLCEKAYQARELRRQSRGDEDQIGSSSNNNN
jgi:hypothetical protein